MFRKNNFMKGILLFITLLFIGCGNPKQDMESGQEERVSQNMVSANVSENTVSGNETGDTGDSNNSESGNLIELSNGLYAWVTTQAPGDIEIEGITEWIMIWDKSPEYGIYDDGAVPAKYGPAIPVKIPNVYGDITDIRMDDYSQINICYKNEEEQNGQATIRIDYFQLDENAINWDEYMGARVLAFDIEELIDETSLPKEVWSETFVSGGKEYTAVYSRVSPIYSTGYDELPFLYADYEFTIRQNEEIVYGVKLYQMHINYEEVHYMEDVNGDGTEDFIQLSSEDSSYDKYYDIPYVFIWDQEQEDCIYGGPISTEEKTLYELPDGRYDSPIYSSVFYDRNSSTFYDNSWFMYNSITNRSINDRIVSCGARFVDGEWKTVYEMYLGGQKEDYARETKYDEEGNVISEMVYTLEEYYEWLAARDDTCDLKFSEYEGYTLEKIVVNDQFSYSKYVRNEP